MRRLPGSPAAGEAARAVPPGVEPKLCSRKCRPDKCRQQPSGSAQLLRAPSSARATGGHLSPADLPRRLCGTAELFSRNADSDRSLTATGSPTSGAPELGRPPRAPPARPREFRRGSAPRRVGGGRSPAPGRPPGTRRRRRPPGTGPLWLRRIAGLGAGLAPSPLAPATCRSAPRRQRRLRAALGGGTGRGGTGRGDSPPDRRPRSLSSVRRPPSTPPPGVAERRSRPPSQARGPQAAPRAEGSALGLALPGWRREPVGSAPPPQAGQGTVAWRACSGRCGPSSLWPPPPPHPPLLFSTSDSDEPRPPASRRYTLAGRGGSAFCLLGRLPLPPPPPNNNKPPRESRHIPTPFAHHAVPLGDKLRDCPLANFPLKPSPREGG